MRHPARQQRPPASLHNLHIRGGALGCEPALACRVFKGLHDGDPAGTWLAASGPILRWYAFPVVAVSAVTKRLSGHGLPVRSCLPSHPTIQRLSSHTSLAGACISRGSMARPQQAFAEECRS